MNLSRTTVSLSAVLLLAVGLSGCAAIDEFAKHEKEQAFATWDDAPQRGDLAFVPAGFIPEDATDLRIRTITDGPGTITSWVSDTDPVGDDCAPASLSGKPLLEAGWWPESIPGSGTVCSTWRIFEDDDVFYAYNG